jgi:hypothetical protein
MTEDGSGEAQMRKIDGKSSKFDINAIVTNNFKIQSIISNDHPGVATATPAKKRRSRPTMELPDVVLGQYQQQCARRS